MWRRRLFVMLSACSLFLCVMLGALWIRSYFCADGVGYGPAGPPAHNDTFRNCSSIAGALLFTSCRYVRPSLPQESSKHSNWSWAFGGPKQNVFETLSGFMSHHYFLGFHYGSTEVKGIERRWLFSVVAIPYWSLVVVTGILPLRSWLLIRGRWRREKRRRLGLCEQCGYDLRGTPDRCPECGVAP